MPATPQQLAVADYVEDATSNPDDLMVEAGAGTGKTTGIVGAAQRWKKPGVSIAFNKLIADTLAERMPDNFLSRTVNSLCFRSYMEATKNFKVEINRKKPYDLAKELGLDSRSFPDAAKAYNIAREWGIAPKGTIASPRSLTEDSHATWERLFSDYDIDCGEHPDPIGATREMLMLGAKWCWKGNIDFTDQKYFPVVYQTKLPQTELVFVDEFQDTSPIDQEVARMICLPDGRIIAVGDRHQAIYGFRGADRNAIPRFIEAQNAKILPLTVCFRCPQAVVREAQRFFPELECGMEAEGVVDELDKLRLSEITSNSAFLCRNNRPLVDLYFRMIKEGIPARLRGRDIGSGIVKLLLDTKRKNLAEALQSMWQNVEHQCRLFEQRGLEERASLLRDKAECAQIIASRVGLTRSPWDFKSECDRLFTDETGSGVLLSSVHKAKGLEWPTVHILDPFLMPSKYAKTQEARIQEDNLQYVAITRSQENLFYINSNSIE